MANNNPIFLGSPSLVREVRLNLEESQQQDLISRVVSAAQGVGTQKPLETPVIHQVSRVEIPPSDLTQSVIDPRPQSPQQTKEELLAQFCDMEPLIQGQTDDDEIFGLIKNLAQAYDAISGSQTFVEAASETIKRLGLSDAQIASLKPLTVPIAAQAPISPRNSAEKRPAPEENEEGRKRRRVDAPQAMEVNLSPIEEDEDSLSEPPRFPTPPPVPSLKRAHRPAAPIPIELSPRQKALASLQPIVAQIGNLNNGIWGPNVPNEKSNLLIQFLIQLDQLILNIKDPEIFDLFIKFATIFDRLCDWQEQKENVKVPRFKDFCQAFVAKIPFEELSPEQQIALSSFRLNASSHSIVIVKPPLEEELSSLVNKIKKLSESKARVEDLSSISKRFGEIIAGRENECKQKLHLLKEFAYFYNLVAGDVGGKFFIEEFSKFMKETELCKSKDPVLLRRIPLRVQIADTESSSSESEDEAQQPTECLLAVSSTGQTVINAVPTSQKPKSVRGSRELAQLLKVSNQPPVNPMSQRAVSQEPLQNRLTVVSSGEQTVIEAAPTRKKSKSARGARELAQRFEVSSHHPANLLGQRAVSQKAPGKRPVDVSSDEETVVNAAPPLTLQSRRRGASRAGDSSNDESGSKLPKNRAPYETLIKSTKSIEKFIADNNPWFSLDNPSAREGVEEFKAACRLVKKRLNAKKTPFVIRQLNTYEPAKIAQSVERFASAYNDVGHFQLLCEGARNVRLFYDSYDEFADTFKGILPIDSPVFAKAPRGDKKDWPKKYKKRVRPSLSPQIASDSSLRSFASRPISSARDPESNACKVAAC